VTLYLAENNEYTAQFLLGNSAGRRTVFSSRISHRQLRSSLRESHSSLILPADTMMASSRGTQPSKMIKTEVTFAFIKAYRPLHGIWTQKIGITTTE
jgi:hypothetical protein